MTTLKDSQEIEQLRKQLAEVENTLGVVLKETANELGCEPDNEQILFAIKRLHVPQLLFEAYDYGNFSDDFDQPLAKPIRAAIRDLLKAAHTQQGQNKMTDCNHYWEASNYDYYGQPLFRDNKQMSLSPIAYIKCRYCGDRTWVTNEQWMVIPKHQKVETLNNI